MSDHCDSRYPDDPRYQCVMHSHPDTIHHYAHSYEQNRVTTYIWEECAEVTIDTSWPEETPTNVRLITTDGTVLPVDLIYLGKRMDDETGLLLDVWQTVPPCTRDDLKYIIAEMPSRSAIRIDRGEK